MKVARVILYFGLVIGIALLIKQSAHCRMLLNIASNGKTITVVVISVIEGSPSTMNLRLPNGNQLSVPINTKDIGQFKPSDKINGKILTETDSVLLIPGVDIQLKKLIGSLIFLAIYVFILFAIVLFDFLRVLAKSSKFFKTSIVNLCISNNANSAFNTGTACKVSGSSDMHIQGTQG